MCLSGFHGDTVGIFIWSEVKRSAMQHESLPVEVFLVLRIVRVCEPCEDAALFEKSRHLVSIVGMFLSLLSNNCFTWPACMPTLFWGTRVHSFSVETRAS